MKRPKVLMVAVAIVLAGGAAATAAVSADASGSNVTYFACLKSGKLTAVSTTAPTCNAPATQISWNSAGSAGPAGPTGPTGPQGAPGPQGLSSAQYVGVNSYADTVTPTSSAPVQGLAGIPQTGHLVITGLTAVYTGNNAPVFCSLEGNESENEVEYDFPTSTNATTPPLTGLQWPFALLIGGVAVDCRGLPAGQQVAVSVTGYTT
jgi:hypothetical protein